jgi:Zn-dependent protease with chaperone function
VQEHIARSVASSPALPNLKSRLRQFYQIGAELYGIQLDPQAIYVVPDMELNAFATGRHVFFYEGLLLYYIDPIQFLIRTKQVPPNMTREAYTQLTYRFNWRNDWDSLYFVLAHEASHNLMAHGDERNLEGMRSQLQQFSSDALAYRKAIAEGHSSPGVKRYLGQSLLSFLSGPERSRQKVSQEEEADAVASEILRRAGLRPDSGLVWLQRMSLLEGQSPTGWQSVMNSLFCSTHPDKQQRMSSLQRNLSCLQYGGRLCAKHITYPVPDRLGMIRSEFAKLEQYSDETNAIADGRLKPATDVRQTVELKPNPKEAKVVIDGVPVEASKVSLAAGRHVLIATRDGYRPARVAFAVFPDLAKATIKFKLKKCERGKPCESELPEEAEVEAETASESRTATLEAEQNPAEVEEKRPYLKRKD